MSLLENLNPLEIWTLARCAAGYHPQPQYLRAMNPLVGGLAQYMDAISFPNREALLRQQLSTKDFERVVSADPEGPAPAPEMEDDSPWTIIHASELKRLPPLEWLVPLEIPKAGLTVIYGESGAGKSFVGIDYALRIAREERVVYIPTEGEGGYKKRVAAWCAHHRMDEGQCYFLFGNISLFDRQLAERLLLDLSRLEPKLIVIDTLAMALAGGDENSARDMGILIQVCRRMIRELDASVVLVHHVNKGGIVERGSGSLRGNADIMIKVSPADDDILVECAKTKDEKPFDTKWLYLLPVLTPDGEGRVIVESKNVLKDATAVSSTQAKILEIMALGVNREGITIRDLETQSGISLGTVNRSLSKLLEKQLVNKPFGSYAITEAGLKAIGKAVMADPLDPTLIHKKGSHLADDPRDPLDPAVLVMADVDQSGSRGSRGSSLRDVDQNGSPVGQPTLLEVPTRPANYYQQRS